MVHLEWNAAGQACRAAVTVTIEKGMGSSQIADLLEQEGIIKHSLFFKGYLKWVQEGSSFKAARIR